MILNEWAKERGNKCECNEVIVSVPQFLVAFSI